MTDPLFLQAYLPTLALILALMSLLWVASLALQDASIVDIFWGSGFVVAALVYFAQAPQGYPPRKLLIVALAAIWGLRLSIHIARRNLGRGEDYRYRRWREQHGANWWWRSLVQVFLLQGLLLWIISAPLLAAQASPTPARLTLLDGLGTLVWGVGFFFEAVGDWQLARFKRNPANRGKVLRTGLWRYTRHPNYFGDATQWWGFYLVALAADGWWTVFSPVLMTVLLVRVSGVALLEKDLKASKPEYRDYLRTTSAFIPLPPKRGPDSQAGSL